VTSEQNAPDIPDESAERADSWAFAVEKFVEDVGGELGDRYAPQIRALRALAAQLDAADTYEATLAAEYARMHRWLLNKTGARPAGSADADEPDLLDMLAQNPGALWRG